MGLRYVQTNELYQSYMKKLQKQDEWRAFLKSACRNYRLRFDEQILVYAQNPKATAVLSMERWNRLFDRWVKKGTTGIAVFDGADHKKQKLNFYFDVADTQPGRNPKRVPVWEMKPEYAEEVMAALEGSFGRLAFKENLSEAVLSASGNAVEDNLPDYLDDLLDNRANSFLEGLDRENVEVIYRTLVTNSVAYMMLARLNFDPDQYFAAEDFHELYNFNTDAMLNSLGYATSDISEMAIGEIAKTVLNLDSKNRMFVGTKEIHYNQDTEQLERSFEDGTDHVFDARGLHSAEPDTAGTAGGGAGALRSDAGELSEKASESHLRDLADAGQTGGASARNGAEGNRDGIYAGQTDGQTGGHHGEAKGDRHDELGAEDEQHSEPGAGNRESRSDIRLTWHERTKEDDLLPFFGRTEDLYALFAQADNLSDSHQNIAAYFKEHKDPQEQTAYVKGLFPPGKTELRLEDGRQVGYQPFLNVLHLWSGPKDQPTAQSYFNWPVIAAHFEGMQLLGLWRGPGEPALPFTFSQEIIDRILCSGSNISEGKMRIYKQFEDSLSAKENQDFLKHEYGWGGAYPILSGTNIDEQHDGKGIHLSKGLEKGAPKVSLPWPAVEKRIKLLIQTDRYLNPKEKERYPQWLEEQEDKRQAEELRKRNQETLSLKPQKPKAYRYEYHPGDTVYLGASQYELQAVDENRVRICDVGFPLFNKEIPLKDFDEQVRQSPFNDHLRKELSSESLQTEQEDAFSGTNEDAFFVTPATEKVQWIYFNPDGDEGRGQYVVNLISFETILKGAELHKDPEAFFEYLQMVCRQELVDRDTPDFTLCKEQLQEEKPDFSGCTAATRTGLIDAASPPEKEQKQADSGKEEAALVPAWTKKKAAALSSFDLHPEVPMAERLNFNLKEHPVEEADKRERCKRNIRAIEVMKTCRQENRYATAEEQEILSKYVGWGGVPEAFDPNASAWTEEYAQLKALLSPEEYDAARESTLTAFYTPSEVIAAIYSVLQNMGFQEGNILEPSCGIGHFMGMLPESMKDSKLYGVELDRISANIAGQMYQKNTIAQQGYEETDLPDSFFDAVVGNVPFGDFQVVDKRYNKYHFLIHDYFFAKSLDKLRPGGVMALITSKGTMDKENPSVRRYIAQRADLLGAIRLPNNTFKGNAGTEVVSDILFLQKRDRIVSLEPDWVHIGTDEQGHKMNSYFIDHPDMILGKVQTVSGRFGPEETVAADESVPLSQQLQEAIANIHGEYAETEWTDAMEEDHSVPADPTVRNFSYAIVDDHVYFRENSRMAPTTVSSTSENRIKGMIRIRDSVRRLIELQSNDESEEEIQAEQAVLNRLYDSFTKKYGLISSRANETAFSQDSSYALLSALEVVDDEGNFIRKADMFEKRTIRPHVAVTSVDTASEALAVSMGEKAKVDMPYMEQLTGKSETELAEDLRGILFLNPLYEGKNGTQAKYLTADEYLSGNVREKLRLAKKLAEANPADYTIHVEALEKVQPKELSAGEISIRLGATWIPPDIVEQFVFEFLHTPRYMQWKIHVRYSELTCEWNIEGKSEDKANIHAYSTYGTDRINAYRIIEETLNLKDVRVVDYVEDAEGKRRPVLNKKETAIAQSKQELIKQGFKDWVWADPQRRQLLCSIYNEKYNSCCPREYDGSHIVFVGMNPEIELKEHQKNAVAHILYGGNTLLAHAVGAGKTYEMAAAAMESKRLGLCNKSLIVVPNHLTEQWASEFLQLYPSANILVATKKDFETKNRKKFCGRIATGEYDAVIIGHSQFEKIPISLNRQREILQQQLQEILDGLAEAKSHFGQRFTVKQLEKAKKGINAKLEKLNDQSRKDDVVTFEELGVDRLFIDESHYYKNLFLFTKMRNVGGIAQTEAQKSSDLFMKCRYLDELTGGRGTVFATGTPISNSMVELYTIQRYLQYNTLQKNGLQNFDAWASTFGETVTAVELTPEGSGYRAKTRFSRFYNLPELMAMFREVADIQTADMLHLPVPKANYHNIAVKPSDIQKELVASLTERADKVHAGAVTSNVDNMLLITNDGRKLALDQRMSNEMLPDFEGSKVNACVENIYRIWSETAEKKSAQLVFCDLSTPKKDGSFSIYTDIRNKLIRKGIPKEEVCFIHDADTEAKKSALFKKVRKGEVRVLMGSTQKMGAGTNVQDKLIALHDLDCPWRPADLEQRSGRIIRQGNTNKEVEIYRYVTEETFDAYLYQLVEGKQRFASQIMSGKSPVRSAEDIDETALSYAEIKMLATGNPYIKEQMDLDIQVQKLRLLKSHFLTEKYALQDKLIQFYPKEIVRQQNRLKGMKEDIALAKEHLRAGAVEQFSITVFGKTYTEKAEGGQAIIDACKAMKSPEPQPIGCYRGFQVSLEFDSFTQSYVARLQNKLTHPAFLGTDPGGNITRMDHVLDKMEEQLETAEHDLENTIQQQKAAEESVKKTFDQEEELTAKTARLAELNTLLNLDKRENEIVEGGPEDGIELPKPEKTKEYER